MRTTEPHRLVHTGRRWYLLAWDVDRADWRTFRVDRATPRIPTGPRFILREPPDPDIAGCTSRGIADRTYRYQGRFTLHAPAHVVADVVTPAAAVVEAVDDETCLLLTGSNSLDQMAVYISLLGFDFDVHEPPELIPYIRAMAARLARAAGDRPPARACGAFGGMRRPRVVFPWLPDIGWIHKSSCVGPVPL